MYRQEVCTSEGDDGVGGGCALRVGEKMTEEELLQEEFFAFIDDLEEKSDERDVDETVDSSASHGVDEYEVCAWGSFDGR